MATLGMILGLTVTALSVAREREMGTFDQLLVSPLQPWEILVGKSVPALIVALSEVTIIFLISLIVFKVPFLGSVLLFYFSMSVFPSPSSASAFSSLPSPKPSSRPISAISSS